MHQADLFVDVLLPGGDDGHREAAVVAANPRPGGQSLKWPELDNTDGARN